MEIRATTGKRKVEKYLKKRVRQRSFKVEDIVLKERGVTTPEEEKLGPHWEGLYVVVACHGLGSYHLRDAHKELPHTWNAKHSLQHKHFLATVGKL